MTVTVEICVCGIEGAIAAEQGGADRIELNSALALGGVTPSLGLVHDVLSETELPVIAMLRPRESGFCYSDREFNVMRRDLDALLDAGVHGIAFGILTTDGAVDESRCQNLLSQFGSQERVFHRAFDVIPSENDALQTLEQLKIDRVMTSGQATSAAAGAEKIADFVRRGSVDVLAAGGVRPHNVRQLVEATGCRQVHAALLTDRHDTSVRSAPGVAFSAQRASDESVYRLTDAAQVRAMVDALRPPG